MKTKWNKEKINYVISILYGIFIVGVLIFSLLSISALIFELPAGRLYLFLAFLFLMLTRILLASFQIVGKKQNKIALYKNLAFGLIYFVMAILVLAIPDGGVGFFKVIAGLYFGTILANRICLMIEKQRVRSYVFNGLILIAAAFLFVSLIFDDTIADPAAYLSILLAVILVVSFGEVLALSFSKIQLKGLIDIMRKTYVFEILYGLVILMVSCSFYFMIMEEEIQTFGDGLWYSFAVVTTIGFGDLKVYSTISRILSVILGIYGIIVVASITSVIVNYYNTVKSDDSDKKPKEIKEDNNEEEKNE